MFDVKINIGVIVVDLFLYLFGILVWFSNDFAHEFGLFGFDRFFAGLFSLLIAFIITVILYKSG